jgi:hypothetical protein
MHSWLYSNLVPGSSAGHIRMDISTIFTTGCAEQRQRLVVDRVIQLALNMGWEGESSWTFVDWAVRDFGMKVEMKSPASPTALYREEHREG